MKRRIEKTLIEGGWVERDAESGQIVAVASGEKVSRASKRTIEIIERVASRDGEALKRLADR